MSLKRNSYLVLTEYQFLQAVNIATAVYSTLDYMNTIYLVRNGSRLKEIDKNKGCNIMNLQIEIFDNLEPKYVAEHILSQKSNHFLFFQGGSTLNVFLAYTLAKRNVEVSLGPDGYISYVNFKKKFYLLSVLKDSIYGNFQLYKKKLFTGKIHRFDYYKYGHHNFIDNLWITHPEKYLHQAKNKINILQLPNFNEKCIQFIKGCYDFGVEFPTENVIYFFNQPLWSKLLDKEYEFLKEVILKFPKNRIIVKLHPLTDSKTKARFKLLDRLYLIESKIPAEVLLMSLKNCVVFSGWSSALITENNSCNYYFNYPIYVELDDHILNQIHFVLLDHISMIKSPLEMTFPNE